TKQFMVESMESLPARTEWMAEFLQFQTDKYEFDQPRQILFDELDRIDDLSADGYAAFAKKTFRKDKAVVIRVKASAKGQQGDTRSKLAFSAKSHGKDITPFVDPSEASRALPVPKGPSVLTK